MQGVYAVQGNVLQGKVLLQRTEMLWQGRILWREIENYYGQEDSRKGLPRVQYTITSGDSWIDRSLPERKENEHFNFM